MNGVQAAAKQPLTFIVLEFTINTTYSVEPIKEIMGIRDVKLGKNYVKNA